MPDELLHQLPDLDGLASALVDRLAPVLASRLHLDRDRLIGRPELAERLGISERSVSALAARGELPTGYLIGGIRRWRWSEVLKHLKARSGRRPRKGRGRYTRGESWPRTPQKGG